MGLNSLILTARRAAVARGLNLIVGENQGNKLVRNQKRNNKRQGAEISETEKVNLAAAGRKASARKLSRTACSVDVIAGLTSRLGGCRPVDV